MKESTKINIKRNFEAVTAGMMAGVAEGVGCEIIGCIIASNARIRTKILASTAIGAITATGSIVCFKVWKRSDDKLGEEYMKAWIKEEGLEEILEEEEES